MIETRLLQYFLAVAEEQSITKAAEYLHITQPTLSKQMMELALAGGGGAFGGEDEEQPEGESDPPEAAGTGEKV